MFPIDWLAFAYISLIGIFLSSASALYLSWLLRIPLLLVATGIPAAWLWPDFLAATAIPPAWLGPYPPTGQYASLGYTIVIGLSVIAMVLGAVCGSVSRFKPIAPSKFFPVLGIVTSAAAAFVLWSQYVPSDCLGTSLQVRIGGSVLHLPPEMQPRVERGNSTDFFGQTDHKFGYARLCRKGRSGTRAVDVDTVSITPAANHDEMTAACNGRKPPAWCQVYSADPYRHMGQVRIGPASELGFPKPYWQKGGSLKLDPQGDLTHGSVCLESIVTQCWTWEPFGPDSRLIVSTSNLDKTFKNMPVADARERATKARDMTLALITSD
jgi:hypothetical protein